MKSYFNIQITWLLLFNQHLLTKAINVHTESDEVEIDQEIIATTVNTNLNVDTTSVNDDLLVTTTFENPTTVDLDDRTEIDTSESAGDDIIDLNVGGERITTLRSTLTAVPGSKLAIMFTLNENKETKSKNTDNTAYFFDYDPTLFKILLNKLRRIKRMSNVKPYEHDIYNMTRGTDFYEFDMLSDLGLTRKFNTIKI